MSADAEHTDYLRALALDSSFGEARAAIIHYLTKTARRDSAHEKLELLLNTRRSLRDAGLEAATADEIIDEVERGWAV